MTPFLQDADITLYCGDVLDTLRELPDETFHMACTSPPFYGLRDYGAEGQIGLEATPDLWVARLVEVFREVRRVMRRDATLWVELGDSFGPGKQLLGSPWRFAFALRADGWYLRSEIIWSKPNPMPESVTDRPTVSHSRVFLLTKSPRYFYDAEAIREPYEPATLVRNRYERKESKYNLHDTHGAGFAASQPDSNWNPAGRNRRSVWTIATEPYPEAHFATWPQKLVEPMILAGTSERGVCPECGAPWERVVESRSVDRPDLPRDHPEWRPSRYDNGKAGDPQSPGPGQRFHESSTTGWQPTCECFGFLNRNGRPTPVPATVLDPFAGSGTTLHVARRLGRHSVGVELNPEYCALAADRLAQQSLLA